MSGVAITIVTDNAAFDGDTGAWEVARILAELSRRIEQWDSNLANWSTTTHPVALFDVNGNRVGSLEWTP
jgi:hypothetical protein